MVRRAWKTAGKVPDLQRLAQTSTGSVIDEHSTATDD
jgi:hypothetical protein